MRIDNFTRAYIECALWSSTDNSNEQGGDPLDKNYTVDDIAPVTLSEIVEDCRQFQSDNAELLTLQSNEQNGHDFWLTRNHHGAGFWDRGLGDTGDKLTEAAHVWGSVDLYVGDDGLIYA